MATNIQTIMTGATGMVGEVPLWAGWRCCVVGDNQNRNASDDSGGVWVRLINTSRLLLGAAFFSLLRYSNINLHSARYDGYPHGGDLPKER
jgi:hypothetical protein